MIVRNFELPNDKEEVSAKQLVEIAMEQGNLGRCLVALDSATEEELKEIVLLLPEANSLRFSAKNRLEQFFRASK